MAKVQFTKGDTTGVTIPVGSIGQLIEGTGVAVAVTTAASKTVATITLTSGTWDVTAFLYVASVPGLSSVDYGIATVTNSATGYDTLHNSASHIPSVSFGTAVSVPPSRYYVSTGSTLSLFWTARTGGANTAMNGSIRGVRVG